VPARSRDLPAKKRSRVKQAGTEENRVQREAKVWQSRDGKKKNDKRVPAFDFPFRKNTFIVQRRASESVSGEEKGKCVRGMATMPLQDKSFSIKDWMHLKESKEVKTDMFAVGT